MTHGLQDNLLKVEAVSIFLLCFLLPEQPQRSPSHLLDQGLSAFNLAASARASFKLTPCFFTQSLDVASDKQGRRIT